jgi:hypothetical protein
MSLIKNIEKTPMQSKKFLAYLLSNLTNKAIIFYMVFNSSSTTVVAWAITAAAFIDVGYILGQAALDGFVRMGQIKNLSFPLNNPDKEDSTKNGSGKP